MRRTASTLEQGAVHIPDDWAGFCELVQATRLPANNFLDRAPHGPVEAESDHLLAPLARTPERSRPRNSQTTTKLLPCQHARRAKAAEKSLICAHGQTCR